MTNEGWSLFGKFRNFPNDLSFPHAYHFVEIREQLPSAQFALWYVRLQVKLNDRPFAFAEVL